MNLCKCELTDILLEGDAVDIEIGDKEKPWICTESLWKLDIDEILEWPICRYFIRVQFLFENPIIINCLGKNLSDDWTPLKWVYSRL
jgi:hypothetical protein